MADELTTLIERLMNRAISKEENDFHHGRKRPAYGRETELEWVAAAAIIALKEENARMRGALVSARQALWTGCDTVAATAKIDAALASVEGRQPTGGKDD